MIHVDIDKLTFSSKWEKCAKQLTHKLKNLPPDTGSDFIEKNREKTWGAIEVLKALRKIEGTNVGIQKYRLKEPAPMSITFAQRVRSVKSTPICRIYRRLHQVIGGSLLSVETSDYPQCTLTSDE